MKTTRILSAVAVLAIAAIGCTSNEPTAPNSHGPVLKETTVAQGVKIEPIGEPIWKPVDFHIVSLEIGTGASGFQEFFSNISAILPEPKHTWVNALGVGPGSAHAGYDGELAAGVKALGLHEGVQFDEKEISDGMGIMLTWMNVPNPGVTGSSPDFAVGPVIPNTIFPINVSGPALHNKKTFDPWLAWAIIPPLDGNVEPRFAGLTGHSHFPMFATTNAELAGYSDYAGKLKGSYTYEITMLDASNNGWRIVGHFAVGE